MDNNKNGLLNKIHLFLTLFILGWLNVNPFIYDKIPMIIKLMVVVLWFALACFKKNFLKNVLLTGIPLGCMIFFMILGNNNELINAYFTNFLYMFIIFSIFLYYRDDENKKDRKIILYFLLIDILYIGINTFIQLLTNPLLSRILAMSTETKEMLLEGEIYNNIGTYGFFYALGIIVLIYIYKSFFENTNTKIKYIIISILSLVLLIQGSFAISILLTFICTSFILIFCNKNISKKILKISVTILLIIMIYINSNNILSNIAMIEWLPLQVKEKITEINISLNNSENMNGTDMEARATVYKKSIDTFKENFLIGSFGNNENIGGHSTFFDFFALYGVFAIFLYYYFFICYKQINKFVNIKYIVGIIFIYYLLLSILNPSIYSNIFVALYIIVPFAIKSDTENKREVINENFMDC